MDGICAVLLQNLFSCNLRCFVAKPILSRFTHFLCGKKLSSKFCLWRKSDKYDVGSSVHLKKISKCKSWTPLRRMTLKKEEYKEAKIIDNTSFLHLKIYAICNVGISIFERKIIIFSWHKTDLTETFIQLARKWYKYKCLGDRWRNSQCFL